MAVIATNKPCLRKAKNQFEKHQMGFDGEHIGEVVLKRLGYKGVKLTSHKSKFDILTTREAWEIKTVGRDALDKKMSVKARQKLEKLAWAKKNRKSPKSMMVIVNDSAEVYIRDGLGKFRPGGMKKVRTFKNWRKEVGHGRTERLVEGKFTREQWMKERGIELQKGITIEAAEDGFRQLEVIPDKVLKRVGTHEGRFRIINHPVTGEKEYVYLKGKIPRGWERTGYTWDDVWGAANDVTVGAIVGKNSGSISTIRHEMGHLVSKTIRPPKLGKPEEFKKAYRKLLSLDAEGKIELQRYFKQPGVAGLEETFAEFIDCYYATSSEALTAYRAGRIVVKNKWGGLGKNITDKDMRPMIDWWEKVLKRIV